MLIYRQVLDPMLKKLGSCFEPIHTQNAPLLMVPTYVYNVDRYVYMYKHIHIYICMYICMRVCIYMYRERYICMCTQLTALFCDDLLKNLSKFRV